jgi:hypothetical protein
MQQTGGTTSVSDERIPVGGGTMITISMGDTDADADTCQPTARITMLSYTSGSYKPGTKNLEVMRFQALGSCNSMSIPSTSFDLIANNPTKYDDMSLYRSPSGENFRNVRLINVETNQVMQEPVNPSFVSSVMPDRAVLNDALTVDAETPITLAVVLDISDTFSAPQADPQYRIYGPEDMHLPSVTTFPDNFVPADQPTFTVTTSIN